MKTMMKYLKYDPATNEIVGWGYCNKNKFVEDELDSGGRRRYKCNQSVNHLTIALRKRIVKDSEGKNKLEDKT